AEDALASLAREPIGVLLADEQMPGMSGIDLLAEAVVRWPDTVRVIVSAYSDPPRLLRAINRGHAHEYIVKPWLKPELAACIDRGERPGERAVRPRAGRVHRCAAPAQGSVRGRAPRDDLPRRGRRDLGEDAGPAVARAAGEGDRASGRVVHDPDRRSSARRHA